VVSASAHPEKRKGSGEPLSDERRFMELALRQAELAFESSEVPVGAVLTDRSGRVLAEAHNAPLAREDPTAHAEILVLRRAAKGLRNYRLPDTILFVTLEPCVMCVGAMLHARVARLVYGAADPKAGAAGSVLDLTAFPWFNHRMDVTGNVLAEESSALLKRFFRERRAKVTDI
jgi:tRNA(Arg) A34 adenosine deaminase TadA